MSIYSFLTIIFLLIFLGLGLFILNSVLRERKRPNNPPIIINHLSQYTGGYSFGVAKKMIEAEDRVYILFSPRLDIDSIDLENNKKKESSLKDYPLFVLKSQVKPNGLVKHRKGYTIYPIKSEHLSTDIIYSEKENIGNIIEDSVKSRDEISIKRKAEENKYLLELKDKGLESARNIADLYRETALDLIKQPEKDEKKK